jgi:predicted amidohydrolase
VPRTVRAAVAQAEPAVLDAGACVEKVCRLVARAAAEGARIVAFGETFVPVYPLWCDAGAFGRWDDAAAKETHARLVENSVEVPSPATDRIGRAAREAGAVVVVGVNERDARGRTLWNALLTFDADGTLAGHHRKLVPTFGERLVWAHGDAAGLAARETAAGRVGGLVCWEHWMPAARQVLHDAAEAVHVAAWPHLREMYLLASRHYAFEGRCWVLAAGCSLSRSALLAAGLPERALFPGGIPDPALAGGSAIIAPDGRISAGPAGPEETILVADLDLGAPVAESLALDTGGHYARPDLFSLSVRRERPGTTTAPRGAPEPSAAAPRRGPAGGA